MIEPPPLEDFEPKNDIEEVALALAVAGVVDDVYVGPGVVMDFATAEAVVEALAERGYALAARLAASGEGLETNGIAKDGGQDNFGSSGEASKGALGETCLDLSGDGIQPDRGLVVGHGGHINDHLDVGPEPWERVSSHAHTIQPAAWNVNKLTEILTPWYGTKTNDPSDGFLRKCIDIGCLGASRIVQDRGEPVTVDHRPGCAVAEFMRRLAATPDSGAIDAGRLATALGKFVRVPKADGGYTDVAARIVAEYNRLAASQPTPGSEETT